MKGSSIFIAAIAGTTAFTLFSYLASVLFKEDFKEPELLGEMIDRVTPGMAEEQSMFTGWLIHYVTGLGFAAAYQQLIQITGIRPTVFNGMLAGAASGYPASFIWHKTLQLHPLPPRKRSLSFHLQLIAGHAIFGGVIFGVFSRLNKRKNQPRR
ncbi:hypothetical protein BH11BAC5_BH11BAC5_08060 [soil metagenome]